MNIQNYVVFDDFQEQEVLEYIRNFNKPYKILIQEYSGKRNISQNNYLRWIYRQVMYELGYSNPDELHEEMLRLF